MRYFWVLIKCSKYSTLSLTKINAFFKGWWHLVAFIDHNIHLVWDCICSFNLILRSRIYCIESLPQPLSNWKLNWRWQDLNPRPFEYKSNVLPTGLSWLGLFNVFNKKHFKTWTRLVKLQKDVTNVFLNHLFFLSLRLEIDAIAVLSPK